MKKLSLLFAALLTATVMNLQAADPVSYLYPEYNTAGDPTSGIKEWKTGSCTNYTVVTDASSTVTWNAGWYVVTGTNVTLSKGAVCNGAVNLILADGAKLTATGSVVDDYDASAGIQVSGSSNFLTIYGQEGQTGMLIATGGNSEDSGLGAAGIGGNGYEDLDADGSGSNITINGGVVTAMGAEADNAGGAGIGGGSSNDDGNIVGKNITINGGKVTATGGQNAAGIGGGGSSADTGSGSDITINGGEVIATSGYMAAGIGGGSNASGSYITINGGKVTANSNSEYGAGIGGGYEASGSYITITGGEVTANGGAYAAGIGGGGNIKKTGYGSHITITGGKVTANGGFNGGAGIGGGDYGNGSYITITGGTVTATGGQEGMAGIGNGYGCKAAASNIFVDPALVLKADNTNPPTTVIAHATITTDIASSLAGKQYATVTAPEPVITGVTLTDFNAAYDGQNHSVQVSGTEEGDVIEFSGDSATWQSTNPSFKGVVDTLIYVRVQRASYQDWGGSAKITITPKEIEVSGIDAQDKEYDGNTTATVSGNLDGVVSGDDVKLSITGTFADKNVGDDKEVTINFTLSGADAGNYVLEKDEDTDEADIEPKEVEVENVVVEDKEYDGNTTATVSGNLDGVVAGDDVKLSITGTFADKNVGDDKEVTITFTLSGKDAGNYELDEDSDTDEADIEAKVLSVVGQNVETKTYDGNTTATIHIDELDGVVEGDDVTVSATGEFEDKNAGYTKEVSAVYTLSGNDAGNYYMDEYTGELEGDIMAREILLQSASLEKEYDGKVLTAYSQTGGTTITDLTAGQTNNGYVDGECFTYSNFFGSQLTVGESDNTFDVSDSETALVSNYNITKEYGKLKVTALDPIAYIDANGQEQNCVQYIIVEDATAQVTWNAGWYVVNDTVTLKAGAVCNGAVNLILTDGAFLTATGTGANAGIEVSGKDNTLTIYGQSQLTGKLSASCVSEFACAIGYSANPQVLADGIYVAGSEWTVTADGNIVPFTTTEDIASKLENKHEVTIEKKVTPSDIQSISGRNADQSVKFIENGQVIILKNGVRYNVLGQVVNY